MKIFCKLHSSNVFGPQKEIKVITAHLFVIKIANGVNLSYNNLIGRIITFYKDEEHEKNTTFLSLEPHYSNIVFSFNRVKL